MTLPTDPTPQEEPATSLSDHARLVREEQERQEQFRRTMAFRRSILILVSLAFIASAGLVFVGSAQSANQIADLKRSQVLRDAAITQLAEQVRSAGLVPVVTPTAIPELRGDVGPVGPAGPAGVAGPAPTEAQVRAAVLAYFLANPPPAGPVGPRGDTGMVGGIGPVGPIGSQGTPGRAPTELEIRGAVDAYCAARGGCVGAQGNAGPQGVPGRGPTDAEVLTAVNAYCSDGRCVGPKGDAGQVGQQGEAGQTGQPGADGQPGAEPESFTFTPTIGPSQTCRDDDHDGAYTCA